MRTKAESWPGGVAASQPFVSVVTPVYNGAEFLAECIESVLSQTYTCWEYVIIDNCSTDDTRQIAQGYADRDERIRVVTNDQFLSATANANKSLEAISEASKYTKMLHADDVMFPRCLEEMVAVAERHPSVGLVGSYRLKGTGTLGNTRVVCVGLPYDTEFVSGGDACRMNLMGGPYTLGTPSAHLLRSEIVRQRRPFYREGHIAEDVEAELEVLAEWDLGFVHQVLVFSRSHKKSITAQHRSLRAQIANGFYLLQAFGKKHLTEAEFTATTRRTLRSYYWILGEDVLRSRRLPNGYWAFHREALARSGFRLNPMRVALGVGRAVLRRLTMRPPAYQ